MTRRDALRTFGTGALAAIGTSLSASPAVAETDDSQSSGSTPRRRKSQILMDGHVHVTNKTFWLGIDMFGGRSGVPQDASGYPLLVEAIGRVTAPKNVGLVSGENWLRVLEQVQGGRRHDGREHERDERHRQGALQKQRPAVPPEARASAATSHLACC